MPSATRFEPEKSELDALLASGIFNRAPNLAQLLGYVCSKYFEGASSQIKEYQIAVEALGRPAEFDQKKDSIVRVEAHRLRKRLRQYYEAEGAGHAIQIDIPPGQYAPQFLQRSRAPVAATTHVLPAVELPGTAELQPGTALEFRIVRSARPRTIWTALTVAVLILASGAFFLWRSGRTRAASAVRAREAPAAAQTSDDIRILAGLETGSYIDAFGRVWQSDRYFEGGTTFHVPSRRILGTRDPNLYLNRRDGAFRYDIPLKPGIYELRLHFAETLFGESNIAGGGESSRTFVVNINGNPALRDFDVISDAGPSAADIRVFKDVSPASDGRLHLSFLPVENVPFLNAIEITPGLPGVMRPIRIVARDRSYTDADGIYWESDSCARGGLMVVRSDPVTTADDPELYHTERFGNLTYTIAVAPGHYTVVMHFAERWFGPEKPGGGGAGSRLFDVLCNGVALDRSLDIYRQAGGTDRSMIRTFHGLEPNAQGKLVISLVPVKNYACINAIEVLDETR